MISHIILAEPLKKKLKNKKLFSKEIREKFYWSLEMLQRDENYPSLRNKKIQGTENYWEFSITMNYRCVYRRDGGNIILLEMGKHEDIL